MEIETQPNIDEMLHAFSILQNLDRMMKEKEHCDLIIKVEEEELHVHKNVVSAGSDYFMAMLKHENIESSSGIVEMKGVKFTSVKACIVFIYTGRVSINETNFEDMLEVASIMQLTALRGKISHFLRGLLTPASFFNLKKIADKFDLVDLKKISNEFALSKLDLIVKETYFNHLDQEYVSFLISSKVTIPAYEDSKLAIVLQWINANTDTRLQHLSKMLSLVDLTKLSATYGRYLVENEPICYESVECMKRFYLSSIDRIESEEKVTPGSISFASNAEVNAFIIFDLTSMTLQSFKPESETWTQMHPFRESAENGAFTAVFMGMFLYVLTSKKRVFTLHVIESTANWLEIKKMDQYHGKYIRATVRGDSIYVSGKNRMEKYNKWEDEWSPVDCDDIPCNECALVEHKGFIYVLGGFDELEVLNCVNKLSVEDASWDSCKPMLSARRTHCAASIGDVIFVAGGFSGEEAISSVEQYDDKTESWTKLSSMVKCRDEFSLCVVGGELFALGNYSRPLDIETYDRKVKRWRIVVGKKDKIKAVGKAIVAALL